jgi:hypothetical protein
MFDKKCAGCGENVERKFRYCPWCGFSLKKKDTGMLGENDFGNLQQDVRLPFGLNGIVSSFVKQLEKDLGNVDLGNGKMPKNFKIQIGNVPMNNCVVQKKPVKRIENFIVGEEEAERRAGLKKVDAESRIKRLGDIVIYEIETPGVSKKEDVVITKLETGLEVRAYSDDVCFIKTIPLKVDELRWKTEKGKVLVEFRG